MRNSQSSSASPPASPEVPACSVLPQLDSKVCMAREQLVADQKRDTSLAPLFECVISGEELDDLSTGFFLKGNVLMRKWTPPQLSGHDSWGVVEQIIRSYEILKLALDNPLSGLLGINKTFDRILQYFFWPGLKGDVRHHCKTCHVCQVAKTQAISPYPLYPIPVIGGPFERVQIDCLGPFHRTKSGNKYLLTIMCTSTRFPEAFLRVLLQLQLLLKPWSSSSLCSAFPKFYNPTRELILCRMFLHKL